MSPKEGARVEPGEVRREAEPEREIPAILVRFSRYSVRMGLDVPQRQETQIVQSRLTLDDSLP